MQNIFIILNKEKRIKGTRKKTNKNLTIWFHSWNDKFWMSLNSKSTLNNLIQKERLSRVANGFYFFSFKKFKLNVDNFYWRYKKFDEKFKRFLLNTLLESCKIFSKKVLKFISFYWIHETYCASLQFQSTKNIIYMISIQCRNFHLIFLFSDYKKSLQKYTTEVSKLTSL